MTMHLRVYVVDDHRLFRAGVQAELGDKVTLIGDAGDVDTAIQGIGPASPTSSSWTSTCQEAGAGGHRGGA